MKTSSYEVKFVAAFLFRRDLEAKLCVVAGILGALFACLYFISHQKLLS